VAHDIYHVVKPLPAGGLWVGTTGHGLSVWRDGTWTSYGKEHGLLDLWVNDVAADPDGTVWLATQTGLYAGAGGRWREHHAKGEPPPLETEFTALARQGKTLWAATMGEGLWGLRDGSWIHVPAELLPGRQVLALLVDENERLWVGSERGLSRYRYDEGFLAAPGSIASEEVKVLHLGDDGVLRAGTRSGKVYARRYGGFEEILRIDPGSGTPTPEGPSP
jgi:ligand-binding sensor domain-containing protein